MLADLVPRALPFVLTAVVALGYPLAALPLRATIRRALLFLFVVPLFLAPLLIPPEERLLRAIAAIVCGTAVIKLYDLHVGAMLGAPASYRDSIAFLFNPFTIVQRKLADEPVPTVHANHADLARGAFVTLVAMVAMAMCFRWIALGVLPFLLEHAAGAILSFAMIWGISDMALALWRWAGLRGRRMNANFFRARTSAEFWRLYNRPVMQLAYEDYFMRLNGRRRPVLTTIIIFALSGLLHEYIAAVAIGRVQGFQMAFFMIQGFAVVATRRVRVERLRPWPAALWTCGTFTFNLATTLLFFASVNQILPWYSSAAPAWMPSFPDP